MRPSHQQSKHCDLQCCDVNLALAFCPKHRPEGWRQEATGRKKKKKKNRKKLVQPATHFAQIKSLCIEKMFSFYSKPALEMEMG